MDWYRVTKTIRGRRYDYWQKTYRVGKQVKTLNKYIGPTGTSRALGATQAPDKTYHYTPEQIAGIKDLAHFMEDSDEEYVKYDLKKLGELMEAPDDPEPIIRMNDLSPKKQKEYMKESMKKIKADHREEKSERAVMYFCRKCDHMTWSTGWEGHCRCGNTTYYVKK